MFSIDVKYKDITISSIKTGDMNKVKVWLTEEQSKNSNEIDNLNIEEFNNRYIEYVVSENEIFTKINKNNILIGILKGRLEFKEKNELWISFFQIDSRFRGLGIGSEILANLNKYFDSKFGINTFYSLISSGNELVEKFWNNCGYFIVRTAKDFYNINGKPYDMLILKRTIT